jgi:hypothetical protein
MHVAARVLVIVCRGLLPCSRQGLEDGRLVRPLRLLLPSGTRPTRLRLPLARHLAAPELCEPTHHLPVLWHPGAER